ncbi:MAG: tol-pal system protein YbgF [Aestuariivirga sp.]
MLKRSLFAFALLATAATLPAHADDTANRMDQLEQRVRMLTGQVEQLTFELKQMQGEKKLSAAEPAIAPQTQQTAAAPVLAPAKKMAVLQVQDANASNGVEAIEETPVLPQATASQTAVAAAAPKALPFGTTKAAQANDGGFQGKILVSAGGIADATEVDAPPADAQDGVQPVSVQQPQAETPDDLFLRSEKALLQLQYADAESGFKDFVSKYPEHNLAGSAEFKLGETYWAQQNYSDAAQAYLSSYKQYPKGRRAPDSLLKLGLSLARLGQKDQACTTMGSVDAEFPSAVEVKKRAQAEFKRAGC